MKKCIVSALIIFGSSVALADHSLGTAMADSQSVNAAVKTAMAARGLSCDIENSIQMAVPGSESNSAWRQVALCYRTQTEMEEAREQIRERGIYGLMVDGVLDVTYSFVNYSAKDLLSISLK